MKPIKLWKLSIHPLIYKPTNKLHYIYSVALGWQDIYVDFSLNLQEFICKPYDILWHSRTSNSLSLNLLWFLTVTIFAGSGQGNACMGIEGGLRFLTFRFMIGNIAERNDETEKH